MQNTSFSPTPFHTAVNVSQDTTYQPLLQLNYEDEELIHMAMQHVNRNNAGTHTYQTIQQQTHTTTTTTSSHHHHHVGLPCHGELVTTQSRRLSATTERRRSSSAPIAPLQLSTDNQHKVQIIRTSSQPPSPLTTAVKHNEELWTWHEESAKNKLAPVRNIYKKKQRPYDGMMSMLSVIK